MKVLFNPRIIPCLLLKGRGLVKTVKFAKPQYVGDPINAVKIFNEKFVDEIIFLDIDASKAGKGPDFDFIAEIASECFIPFCYGGGVKTVDDAARLFNIGVEKIAVNSAALDNPDLIGRLAERFGSQSIVVAMDIRKSWTGGYSVVDMSGKSKTTSKPVEYAQAMQKLGAGEIFLNNVDLDGTMQGYDIKLLKLLSDAVTIPVVACGGAGRLEDFSDGVKKGGASAVAAGSTFVFYGRHRAVLINYPEISAIRQLFK